MDLLVQSSKVLPQSSPKHGQVVTGIPHYASTNLSWLGFLFLHKHHDQEALGEERVYSVYSSTLLFITKGSQDWNSSRSGSRSWCRGHGGMFFTDLFPLACSAYSLINSRLPAQRWHHPQGDLPTLITIWENALLLDFMEALPQLKLLSLW